MGNIGYSNVRVIDRDAAAEVRNAASEIRGAAHQLRLGNERLGIEALREVSSMMGDLRWISSNVGVEAAREFRGGLVDLGAAINDATVNVSDNFRIESRHLAQSIAQASQVLNAGGIELAGALRAFGQAPVQDLRDWLYGPVNAFSACMVVSTIGSISPLLLNIINGLEPYHSSVIKEMVANWQVSLAGFLVTIFIVVCYVSIRSLWAEMRVVAQQARWARAAVSPAAPTGSMVLYCGLIAPAGWLFCDGAILDVVRNPQYHDLAGLLGNRFDYVVNGVLGGAIRLPDFRGRFPGGSSPDTVVGSYMGAATVSLIVDNLPVHNHPIVAGGAHNHPVRLEYGSQPVGAPPYLPALSTAKFMELHLFMASIP